MSDKIELICINWWWFATFFFIITEGIFFFTLEKDDDFGFVLVKKIMCIMASLVVTFGIFVIYYELGKLPLDFLVKVICGIIGTVLFIGVNIILGFVWINKNKKVKR